MEIRALPASELDFIADYLAHEMIEDTKNQRWYKPFEAFERIPEDVPLELFLTDDERDYIEKRIRRTAID